MNDGFLTLALAPFRRYFDFSGRSIRKEYVYNFLFVVMVSVGVGIYAGLTGADVKTLGDIMQLVVLIPSIAVVVRRLHDTNHRGWWILVPLVNLFFLLSSGEVGPNRFGPDPKQ